MQEPAYQRKLEGMVPDQKDILVGAAYGDSRVWDSLAALYRFPESDQVALRTYIFRTYPPDGRPVPEPSTALTDALRAFEPEGSALVRD